MPWCEKRMWRFGSEGPERGRLPARGQSNRLQAIGNGLGAVPPGGGGRKGEACLALMYSVPLEGPAAGAGWSCTPGALQYTSSAGGTRNVAAVTACMARCRCAPPSKGLPPRASQRCIRGVAGKYLILSPRCQSCTSAVSQPTVARERQCSAGAPSVGRGDGRVCCRPSHKAQVGVRRSLLWLW